MKIASLIIVLVLLAYIICPAKVFARVPFLKKVLDFNKKMIDKKVSKVESYIE